MNRQQLFLTARRAVETRRQQAQRSAAKRRQAIYDSLPELAVLVQQQAEAGATAARLAADSRTAEAKEKLLHLENIRQRRHLLLQQNGYSEQDLLPNYTCKICEDTGTVGGRACTCVIEETRRMRREDINNHGPLMLCRFETFDVQQYPESMQGALNSPRRIMQTILQDCRDYARHFGMRSRSLLMYGDAGLGKTHLALSIAAQVLDAGWDVIYVSAQSAFSAVGQDKYNNSGSELFASMLEADLLVLDDLGTEYLDAYVLSRLYELVNERMYRKPTIYTSNIFKQEMFNQRYTEKIASRLLGECHLMRFAGMDIRLKNKQ